MLYILYIAFGDAKTLPLSPIITAQRNKECIRNHHDRAKRETPVSQIALEK